MRETCNFWRNYDDINDSWDSIKNVIQFYGADYGNFSEMAGPGAWNDPDMVGGFHFYRRDMASLNYSISILLVWRKMLTSLIWARSSEFGSYHLCEQRRFGRSCASAQSRQNLSCSLKQAMSQEEPSDRKPDPWPLWMTGHEQLKFFMTRNARRHKFAWRGPYSCASVNNNKKCAIGRSENEQKSVLWEKMFIFVVAYMNMINDVGNLT